MCVVKSSKHHAYHHQCYCRFNRFTRQLVAVIYRYYCAYLWLPDGISDDGLPSRVRVKVVGVDDVADGTVKTRLEYNAGQCQPGEPTVIPAGHTTHVDGRVGSESAELELFASRRGRAGGVIHGQSGDAAPALDGRVVPPAVVQIMAGHQDLGAGTEVVPQPHGPFDHFQFEKIVRATIVRVHEQSVWRPRLKLHLQRAVHAGIPLAELAICGAVQHQRTCRAEQRGHAKHRGCHHPRGRRSRRCRRRRTACSHCGFISTDDRRRRVVMLLLSPPNTRLPKKKKQTKIVSVITGIRYNRRTQCARVQCYGYVYGLSLDLTS